MKRLLPPRPRRTGATPLRGARPARAAEGAAPAEAPGAELRPVAELGAGQRLGAWAVRHLQVLFYTLGQLYRAPLSTLLTAAVIGIALALPAGLHVLLKNVQQVMIGWEDAAQISLFIKREVDEPAIEALAGELRARPEIAEVAYVSRAQALAEFKAMSGFGAVLDALADNPLPATLVVRPAAALAAPADLQHLLQELQGRAEVDLAQLDLEWVQRLQAMMAIGQRGVLLLAALLALAVLLITGNTIRLAIHNRREEIEVNKLVGATHAFIRRPFLYSGALHGLLGGLIAWLAVILALGVLHGPVSRLSALYQSRFELAGLGWDGALALLALGAGLGLLGAWAVVERQLRQIEPR